MTHVRSDDEESALPRQPTPTDLKPGTSAWRVNGAMCAHQFFSLIHPPEVAATIGKPEHPPADLNGGQPTTVAFEPWSLADFSKYLHSLGRPAAGEAVTLHRLLNAIECAGLLLPFGWNPQMPIMGQQYIS